MAGQEENQSFGVFKPVGYVVISFPTAEQQQSAVQALAGIGLQGSEVRQLTDIEMLTQIRSDLEQASPLAAIGQEINLIKAHEVLARRGYHWLVVHAPDDDKAREVADLAKPLGAERAQQYGHFIIEELIEHPTDLPQVAESPDRGLDAQVPSGREAERVAIRGKDDAA